MKRTLFILFTVFLLLSLCACGKTAPAMQIAPAELTEEEIAMAELLGEDGGQQIFDFRVTDPEVTVQINTYRLVDGEWDLKAGGGGLRFAGSQGRIALNFEKIPDGIRIAVQGEKNSSSTKFAPQEQEFKEIGSYASNVLSNVTEITYGQEIPLAVQILTNKNQIRSFDTSYFFHPEDYEAYGYEGVFAVTVCFLQEPPV